MLYSALWYLLGLACAAAVGYMWFAWFELLAEWERRDPRSWQAHGKPGASWLAGWGDHPNLPSTARECLIYAIPTVGNDRVNRLAKRVTIAQRVAYGLGGVMVVWLVVDWLR